MKGFFEMATLGKFKAPLLGALAGAIVSTVIGFTFGGWMTASKADFMAADRSKVAVISVLAPLCAQSFKDSAIQPAQLIELKAKSTWEQIAFVEKGGWAKMPGAKQTNTGVAQACAEMIVAGN